MSLIRWVLGGLVGASIGALAWILIGYFTGYEVGWIAWGIGLLAGIGTRISTSGEDNGGVAQGVVAAVVAVLVVLGAKYAVFQLMMRDVRNEIQGIAGANSTISDDDLIVTLADEIAKARIDAGQPVNWPPDMTYDDAYEKQHYPADIWQEAEKQWQAKPEAERDAARAERIASIKQFQDALNKQLERAAMTEFFQAIDLLWVGLALFTAFRVGMSADE